MIYGNYSILYYDMNATKSGSPFRVRKLGLRVLGAPNRQIQLIMRSRHHDLHATKLARATVDDINLALPITRDVP